MHATQLASADADLYLLDAIKALKHHLNLEHDEDLAGRLAPFAPVIAAYIEAASRSRDSYPRATRQVA